MSANLLSLNPTKTEFLVIGLPQQLAKLNNPTITIQSNTTLAPVAKARNLGIIFDNQLGFAQQISALVSSCNYHIRDLRRVRMTLNLKTARMIATSLLQSKLDYCNSLYLNLPAHELNRLQLIQNSMARAVCIQSKFYHVSPTLQFLHWLKIKELIEYKVLSLTYSVIQYGKPLYLRNLLTLQSSRSTRSSSLITLERPPTSSRKIENRSFYYTAPALWNALPAYLRHPSPSSSSHDTPVIALTRRQFLSRLKTHLFTHSFPP